MTRRWIVIEEESDHGDFAIVEADDEREAAQRGAEKLYDEALERAGDRGMIDTPIAVFVLPWDDRCAWAVNAVATIAAHQCCGGNDSGREPDGVTGAAAGQSVGRGIGDD